MVEDLLLDVDNLQLSLHLLKIQRTAVRNNYSTDLAVVLGSQPSELSNAELNLLTPKISLTEDTLLNEILGREIEVLIRLDFVDPRELRILLVLSEIPRKLIWVLHALEQEIVVALSLDKVIVLRIRKPWPNLFVDSLSSCLSTINLSLKSGILLLSVSKILVSHTNLGLKLHDLLMGHPDFVQE